MRSAVLSAPRHVELRDLSPPEPGPGQVLVRIRGCGVCGSDLPIWLGRPWFEYPREPGAPGHEAWGVLDAVGPGVEGLQDGDHVTGLTYRSYAEFDLAEAGAVVKLPAKLEDVPFPGEPLACAVNVMRRSGIVEGSRVAIVGIGFLGGLLTQLALARGADVFAIARRPYPLWLAQTMGARVLTGKPEDIIQRIARVTAGGMCDVSIEAAGTQASLDLASALARVRGRLVIAGRHLDGTRTVDMRAWNRNGLDVVNAHEREPSVYREGLELAVQQVAAGHLDPGRLYTHSFALDELDDAFQALEGRGDPFIKALVRC